MSQPKKIILIAAFFILSLFGLRDSFAQTQPTKRLSEPSFDVVLQIVVASNSSPEKSAVSPSLSSIVRKLKSDFPFSDYRLTSMFMQRVSNNGNIELKSVSYETKQDKNFPVFSEWVVSGLQNLTEENGQETIQIQNFRFGQRVPIVANGGVNYEQTGLSSRFNLPKNTPTVVGSLTTATPNELMFLILTVKSAEK